ncbi:uncharacterized protein ACNLHF_003672 [Anomaloglossus baeobatrachus]
MPMLFDKSCPLCNRLHLTRYWRKKRCSKDKATESIAEPNGDHSSEIAIIIDGPHGGAKAQDRDAQQVSTTGDVIIDIPDDNVVPASDRDHEDEKTMIINDAPHDDEAEERKNLEVSKMSEAVIDIPDDVTSSNREQEDGKP